MGALPLSHEAEKKLAIADLLTLERAVITQRSTKKKFSKAAPPEAFEICSGVKDMRKDEAAEGKDGVIAEGRVTRARR